MVSRNRIAVWRTAILVAGFLQAACATTDLSDFQTVEVNGEVSDASILVDDLPLRSGQIVVREAASSVSFLMNLMAGDYAPFGHAGIVVREADGFFVYDAFSHLNSQFWEPPTRRLHGKIRRIKLATFLQRGTVSAVYEHSDIDLGAVAAYARDAYENRLAFDGLFDYRTPDRVYCSEFVAAALHAAGHEEIPRTPRTDNPSLNRVMDWLELDTPGFILAASLIGGATEVARISPHFSASQIDAHFAYERELHRRFTVDQKLGNLFEWTLLGPRVRPHLIELHDQLMDGADAADDPDTWAKREVSLALERSLSQVVQR